LRKANILSTERIYEELLSLPELVVDRVDLSSKRVDISCHSRLGEGICPSCLSKCHRVNQTHERTVQDLALAGRKVYLHLSSRQWICDKCDRHFYESFSFLDSNATMTQRYEKFIYYRCIGVDLQYVVVHEDHCWQTVNRIFQKWSTKSLASVNLFGDVRAIGIDEIALYKGRGNYVCVLVNLETGQVLDVLPDRTKAYLIDYFKALGDEFCQQIEVFSSDLWDGYVGAAELCFPQADIVLDRFHFFGQLQQALDHCRKALRRDMPQDDSLKSLKWTLLRPAEKLSDTEINTLQAIFEREEMAMLKEAYEAKENFRDILQQDLTPKQAEAQLEMWVEHYSLLGHPFLNKFLKTFHKWKSYILNYFKERWSNGIVEGINNRIKMIKRRAFGFLKFKHFRLRILVEFAQLH